MNLIGVSSAIGLPTLLVLLLTYVLGRRRSRVDYAAALQKMALDQASQLDDRLERADQRATDLESKLDSANARAGQLTAALDHALARARRAEEESALRGQALTAAGLPVPVVPAPNVAGGN